MPSKLFQWFINVYSTLVNIVDSRAIDGQRTIEASVLPDLRIYKLRSYFFCRAVDLTDHEK